MVVRLIKYALGGLSGFILDLLFVNLFMYFGVSYYLSIILGFVIAAWLFSYFFHRHVTFEAQNDGEHSEHLSKFSVVTIVVFILDVGTALVFTKFLLNIYHNNSSLILFYIGYAQEIFTFFAINIPKEVLLVNTGKILGAMIGGIGHYILLHLWVFKKQKEQSFRENSFAKNSEKQKKVFST